MSVSGQEEMQRNKIVAYSITSSASDRRLSEIFTPSAFAVLAKYQEKAAQVLLSG
jgi:hypothetical protein